MDLETQQYQIPPQQIDSGEVSHKEEQGVETLLKMNPRIGFIRKVYGIISFQMTITVIFCICSMAFPSFAAFQFENPAIMIVAASLSLIIVLSLICFTKCSRRVPYNYVFLTIFTICEAYMVSSVCALTEPRIVIMAAVMTLGVTVSLTLYAFLTKNDFTIFAGFLFTTTSSLILSLIFMFFDFGFLHIFICSLAVIVYGMYLVYDTQLIIGGHHLELGYDEYIIGSLVIYLDIMVLFLRILEILNAIKK